MKHLIDKDALLAENDACILESQNVLTYIDSLQEEPVNRTHADVESAMQEVEEKSRAFTEAHQGEDTDTILAQMRGEEPVIKDLEEAASLYVADDALKPWQTMVKEAFKSGAKWGKNNAKVEIQAQSMAIAHGCPKVSVSEDLEAAVEWFNSVKYKSDLSGTPINAFKAGAKWQKVKTLSNVKKAVTGKMFQFSMDNVEAWGDDSNGNGKTIKLKGRITFRVCNPESIIDALISELENDN